jgi:hypothetical protein
MFAWRRKARPSGVECMDRPVRAISSARVFLPDRQSKQNTLA